jgi:hypothetical protein
MDATRQPDNATTIIAAFQIVRLGERARYFPDKLREFNIALAHIHPVAIRVAFSSNKTAALRQT